MPTANKIIGELGGAIILIAVLLTFIGYFANALPTGNAQNALNYLAASVFSNNNLLLVGLLFVIGIIAVGWTWYKQSFGTGNK